MVPFDLPPSIGKPADSAALFAAEEFADCLADLQWPAWLAIGRSFVDGAGRSTFRSTPRAILEATINDAGLTVAAWYVRDAIDTAACYASPPLRRWSPAEQRCFAAAHAAAVDAALAILAWRFLSAEDCDALCAPFAGLVEAAGRTAA